MYLYIGRTEKDSWENLDKVVEIYLNRNVPSVDSSLLNSLVSFLNH